MAWPDIISLLDLIYENYELYGENEDLENQFIDVFFR